MPEAGGTQVAGFGKGLMGSSRSGTDVSSATRLRLFAASAGHCQRPECRRSVFDDRNGDAVHFAEVAHIIGASATGPRGEAETLAARGSYDNLILLCPTCHTVVDKSPELFPAAMLRQWKREHACRIAGVFGAVEHPDRASVRRVIEPMLDENRAIFEMYGPDNDYRTNPESEWAGVWQRKVRATLLPNNRRLLLVLDANRRHLAADERRVLEAFRQHVDDLEARHVAGVVGGRARRFPEGMDALLEGSV